MKLTDIQIDRFGVWRDLSLPLSDANMQVFYGPNEAGKTTLMRFIRGVLYGFEPGPLGINGARRNRGDRSSAITWSGSLGIDQGGLRDRLQRAAHQTGRGTLSVRSDTGDDESGVDSQAEISDVEMVTGSEAEEWLADCLKEIDEQLFERVFAIGLYELQELATLQSDEVSRHIYEMSLGPTGQRLLDVGEDLAARKRRLLNSEAGTGTFLDLLRRDAELADELELQKEQRRRHTELLAEQNRVSEQIADLKTRQAGIHSQLRGHQFLERVWTPWKRVEGYQRELNQLPLINTFPEDGLERFDQIEDELNSAVTCKEMLLAEASQFRKQADALPFDSEFQRYAATMQSFVDQREWLVELADQVDQLSDRAETLKADLDESVQNLGSDWSLNRLAGADTTPTANLRLVNTARSYQAALVRRSKLRRRCRRLSEICHKRSVALDDQLKSFGSPSVEEAIQSARKRLTDLEDLGQLSLREAELEQKRIGVKDQLERLEAYVNLPKWVYGILGFFGITGLVLAIAGFATGVTTSGIAGSIYAILGITCGGVAWALKSHFEGDHQLRADQLSDDLRETEVRLRETREAIARLSENDAAPCDSAAATTTTGEAESDPTETEQKSATDDRSDSASVVPSARRSHSEAIRQASHQLAQLEQLARKQRRLQSLRRRSGELRARFQNSQRDVNTARQNWCELLVQLGLTETVRVDEAFDQWQRLVETDELRRRWNDATRELREKQRLWQSFRQRMDDLNRRIPGGEDFGDFDRNDPSSLLTSWDEALRRFDQNQTERRRLRREEKKRRAEASEYQSQIDELKAQRAALLVQTGATSREEFEERALAWERRQELNELLEIAQEDLEAAAQTEPELAVVEEDLRAFDPDENQEQIEVLMLELDELDHDLQTAFENQGSLKQEVHALRSERRERELRLERAQLATELRQAAEQWCSLQYAGRAVDRIRNRFERTHQPHTLSNASRFLERLTGGKYRNIWTPLGERALCVDDGQGRSFRVEQLSRGTREQLFLAIRLAMVEQFRQQGIELPMVLDDVVVNFDQLRTEAAVDTLLEFAAQGQQILLFTCHLHLAHLFESKGISPVWLPGHHASIEERRAG